VHDDAPPAAAQCAGSAVRRSPLVSGSNDGRMASMSQHPLLHVVRYPPDLRQPTHVHGGASLTLLLDGCLYESVGRREVSARAGQWCHKAAWVEHATAFGPAGATTLQLSLPDRHALAPGLSWRWGCNAAVTQLLWALLGAKSPVPETELLEDLAALLGPCEEDFRAPPWWARAHDSLCEGTAPISAVAADCGVHRAQLVRVTQRLAGCTPVVLRQRARPGRCLARLVREPGLALCELALAGGFADQAHFNRECRRWLGQTPGRWRRSWATADAAVPGQTFSAP
jgi:AraC-like DNA-binding protein